MQTRISKFVSQISLIALLALSTSVLAQSNNTSVILDTSLGNIEIELFDSRAPKTVENFLSYVKEGFYDGTIFHRVIPNFMIQGGGFIEGMNKKPTKAPIKNEANAFVPNVRGTIAMARTNDPHSATAQFFINVVDNHNLNKSSYNAGYAVFGKVTKGLDIADKISKAKTKAEGYMRDIPVQTITIKSIKILDTNTADAKQDS